MLNPTHPEILDEFQQTLLADQRRTAVARLERPGGLVFANEDQLNALADELGRVTHGLPKARDEFPAGPKLWETTKPAPADMLHDWLRSADLRLYTGRRGPLKGSFLQVVFEVQFRHPVGTTSVHEAIDLQRPSLTEIVEGVGSVTDQRQGNGSISARLAPLFDIKIG